MKTNRFNSKSEAAAVLSKSATFLCCALNVDDISEHVYEAIEELRIEGKIDQDRADQLNDDEDSDIADVIAADFHKAYRTFVKLWFANIRSSGKYVSTK